MLHDRRPNPGSTFVAVVTVALCPTVVRRTREPGLWVALGAAASQVRATVVRQAFTMATVGG